MQRQSMNRIVMLATAACATALVAGCYKELPSDANARSNSAPAAAAPANGQAAGGEKAVAPTAGTNQPASSALGSAKRSAENTVHQAEQASQQAVDQATRDH